MSLSLPEPVRVDGRLVRPCTIDELCGFVDSLLANPALRPRTLSGINAHVANLARDDPDFAACLDAMACLSVDGVSFVWAGRRAGGDFRERCNTTEAFRAWLARGGNAVSAILIGCDEQCATEAARTMEATGRLRIETTISGWLENEEILGQTASARPVELLLVGMGSPRSERLMPRLAEAMPQAVVWHIGGGTINFYAGRKREAPPWMRRAGLQWLHRLALEPRRMWRRYLIGNPRFVWRALRRAP